MKKQLCIICCGILLCLSCTPEKSLLGRWRIDEICLNNGCQTLTYNSYYEFFEGYYEWKIADDEGVMYLQGAAEYAQNGSVVTLTHPQYSFCNTSYAMEDFTATTLTLKHLSHVGGCPGGGGTLHLIKE